MANGFTKLHGGILGSTIWREAPYVKVVWITLLAMADQDGVAEATVPGLAAFANVSIEETQAAIEKFLSPDKFSRTPDCEGRRIEVVDGGWRLLNYEKYREKLSKEELKERGRVRQQRYRDRLTRNAKRNASVTECDSDDLFRSSRQADAEAESRLQSADAVKPTTSAQSTNERGGVDSADGSLGDTSKGKNLIAAKRALLVAELYGRYPRKVAKAEASKAIAKAIAIVAKRGTAGTPADEEAAAQWLGTRVDLYARSAHGRQPDKSKIPYPATWFNSGRFDDDPAEWDFVVGAGKGATSREFEQIGAGQDHGFEEALSRPDPEWVKADAR